MKTGKIILAWALALCMLLAWSGLAVAAAKKDDSKSSTKVEKETKKKKTTKKATKKKTVKKDDKAKKDTKKKATKKTAKKKAAKKDTKATKKKTTKKAAKKDTKTTKKKAAKKSSKKTTKKTAAPTKWTPPQKAININKASARELQAFYGIGEVRSKAIVDYRKKHGSFKKPEDLMKVEGVGGEIFKKNKKYIKTR